MRENSNQGNGKILATVSDDVQSCQHCAFVLSGWGESCHRRLSNDTANGLEKLEFLSRKYHTGNYDSQHGGTCKCCIEMHECICIEIVMFYL